MTAPFISSEDLAAYVKADELGLEPNLALIALDAACSAVRGYIDQNAESTTVTDGWLDGTGTCRMLLPQFPIVSISALSVYVDRADTNPEILVENTDYVLNYESGILDRIDGGVFYSGEQNIKLSYVYGYSTVPADVRLVALQVAARIYETGIVKNESVAGVSATYMDGAGQLNRDERYALRRYRS